MFVLFHSWDRAPVLYRAGHEALVGLAISRPVAACKDLDSLLLQGLGFREFFLLFFVFLFIHASAMEVNIIIGYIIIKGDDTAGW